MLETCQVNSSRIYEKVFADPPLFRDYVEKQFDGYLTDETRVNRLGQKSQDTRVHACLYFISPVGHGLKPLDLEFMRMLQNSINIIPVIAKADTFTVKEQNIFKQNVRTLFEKFLQRVFFTF